MALTRTETEDRILRSLRARNGVVTIGDAVADTGLPSDDVEDTLGRLLRHYASHLDVDVNGALRYRFDPAFVRRGQTDAGRRWQRLVRTAARAFRWFTKGWIMVVLVGYSITFIVLLAVAAIASIFADEDGGLAALPLYVLARVLEALFYIRLFGPDSRLGARTVARGKKRKKPRIPFYRRVFNFVLGPERGGDPLAAQRAFTAFVRAHKGTVSAAEWAAYSGRSFETAQNALTAAALRFRASVNLGDDGVLLYRFDELVLSASVRALEQQHSVKPTDAETLLPIWEQPVRPAPLTGNSFGWNLWIGTLNVFNVLMGLVFVAADGPVAVTLALGYMPVAFGLFFFGVPLLRLFKRLFSWPSRGRELERRNLMKEVFARTRAGENEVPLPPAWQTLLTGRQARAQRRRRRRAATVLPRLVADLEGEPAIGLTLGDAGVYRFDRLAAHLTAAATARGVKETNLRFGATIFSSDEDSETWDKRELTDFDRRLARELAGPS